MLHFFKLQDQNRIQTDASPSGRSNYERREIFSTQDRSVSNQQDSDFNQNIHGSREMRNVPLSSPYAERSNLQGDNFGLSESRSLVAQSSRSYSTVAASEEEGRKETRKTDDIDSIWHSSGKVSDLPRENVRLSLDEQMAPSNYYDSEFGTQKNGNFITFSQLKHTAYSFVQVTVLNEMLRRKSVSSTHLGRATSGSATQARRLAMMRPAKILRIAMSSVSSAHNARRISVRSAQLGTANQS